MDDKEERKRGREAEGGVLGVWAVDTAGGTERGAWTRSTGSA